MSIYLYCEHCYSTSSRGERKCSKCKAPFGHSKRYRVVVRCEGQRSTGLYDNLALAQEGEAELKKELKERVDAEKQPEIPTLNDLWAKYLPFAKSHKATWRDDDYHYRKHLEPRFGDKPLNSILPLDIERMKKDLREGANQHGKPYKPATIKHQLVLLRRLFNIAMKWNLYQGPNPVNAVEMPKVHNQITEFLTDQQLANLMATLEAWDCRETVAFVKLALFTGIRRGEVFKLEWRDVDFERALLTLRDPKGGPTQVLPLSQEALDVLHSVERGSSPYLFPGKDGQQRTDFKGPWMRIRKAAGLPEGFRFQGLRHNFASTLISNGVDLAVVGKLLTHKQAQTTMRYAHLRPDVVKAAALKSGELLTPKKQKSNILELNK